jgi:hypothetical protein
VSGIGAINIHDFSIVGGGPTVGGGGIGIEGSRGSIANLNVSASDSGFVVAGNSEITIMNPVVNNSNASAIVAQNSSSVYVVSASLLNVAGGVEADGNSNIALTGTTTITGITNAGILANGSANVSMGGRGVIQGSPVSPGFGVQVIDNGYVKIGGAITISGHARGVHVRHGVFDQRQGTLLIQDNTDVGISVIEGGSVLLSTLTLNHNGSTTSSLTTGSANLLVSGTASANLNGATIKDGPVTGIVVRDGSSVLMQGGTITGNQNDGIHVETLSGVRFDIGGTNTVTGNSKYDLVCDQSTFARGSKLVTLGKSMCMPELQP